MNWVYGMACHVFQHLMNMLSLTITLRLLGWSSVVFFDPAYIGERLTAYQDGQSAGMDAALGSSFTLRMLCSEISSNMQDGCFLLVLQVSGSYKNCTAVDMSALFVMKETTLLVGRSPSP